MLIVVKHIRDTNPKSCIVKLSDYRLFLEDNQNSLFRRKLESEFADVDSVERTSLLKRAMSISTRSCSFRSWPMSLKIDG